MAVVRYRFHLLTLIFRQILFSTLFYFRFKINSQWLSTFWCANGVKTAPNFDANVSYRRQKLQQLENIDIPHTMHILEISAHFWSCLYVRLKVIHCCPSPRVCIICCQTNTTRQWQADCVTPGHSNRYILGLLNSATLSSRTLCRILIKFALLPGHIHVILYFMYYSTTSYNPATDCYMIINNYTLKSPS